MVTPDLWNKARYLGTLCNPNPLAPDTARFLAPILQRPIRLALAPMTAV